MTYQKKIKVAVLYGGRSGEHEVSVRSATNVIQNLDKDKFEVIPIGIDKQGSWYLGEQISASGQLELHREEDRMLFAPEHLGTQSVSTTKKEISKLHQSERLFDVIFPVIHGVLCEDGTVQGLLELADVPYVGCGVLSSAVGMDKDVSKRLIQGAGINVAPFLVVKRGEWERHAKTFCQKVEKELTFPVFVKPANTGSSVGVQKIKQAQDLAAAIEIAFQFDTKVIVEKGIDAIELEVGVLESNEFGADPIVSVVGEVKPSASHEFYSYAAKYLDENGAELMIPANISKSLQEHVRELAKKIFNVLDCEGMARIDLFLERGTNEIYFNEVNTLPGFTQISMYPILMGATGISYSDLLTRLVHTAIDRHTRRSQLVRDYVAE